MQRRHLVACVRACVCVETEELETEAAFDLSADEINTKLRQTHKCRHCLPPRSLACSVLTSSSAENVSHQGGAIINQVSELHQL